MKVALVLCPEWAREMPHLAIGLLSACLRKEGHQVYVRDLNNDFYHACQERYKDKWRPEHDFFWSDRRAVAQFVSEHEQIVDRAVREILETGARMIGFSVYHPTELMTLELAKRIKAIDPGRMVVLGGFQCMRQLKGKILIQDPAVDAVVTGEGEETLVELAANLAQDGVVKSCPGVILKNPAGIVDGGDRAPIAALDALPFPDFSDFSSARYEKPDWLPMLFSRGCFQPCVYCTVNIFWRKYRAMSGKRMFQAIEWCRKTYPAVRELFMYDPLVNGDIRALTQLCNSIIAGAATRSMPLIHWNAQAIIRPEMTRELLGKMKQAGCRHLAYGIESGSQAVLDKMRKRFSIADAERVVRHTHEAGMEVSLNFMFGFPDETVERFQETLDFLTRNHEYIDRVLPSESFCYIDNGTYLYEHPGEFSVTLSPDTSFWESMDGRNNFPERMRRFEVFCEHAEALGIEIGASREKVRLIKEEALGRYSQYRRRRSRTDAGEDRALI